MITFLLIFLAAFFKSIADTIRVPETMKFSVWSKYQFNTYIDPQVSWINKYKVGFPLNMIWTCVSDLWHLCTSLMIICFMLVPFFFSTDYSWWILLFMWLCYGVSFEFWWAIWKTFKK